MMEAPIPTTRDWLRSRRPLFGRAAGLAVVAASSPFVPNVWYRLAASYAVLVPLALSGIPAGWRELYRPRWRLVAIGLAGAAALYAAGAVVTRLLLLAVPAASAQIAALYAWRRIVPEGLVLPLLLFIILGEEIVWRNAVTIPFAARLGPVLGCLAAGAAFAAAHLSLGVPMLLVAALAAGSFWSGLVVGTRSAWPALACHVAWDLAVMLWWPYAAAG
jgi:membrane protease YdiL (CAAX protease family)